MKKLIIFLTSFIVFISIFMLIFLQPLLNKSFVLIDGKKFTVDVAKTSEQQKIGLDIYNKLPTNKGMIFPFELADYYPFWMKGMKFSIDIIYIKDNKIVDIFQNLPFPKDATEAPATVRPSEKANYVLEINAGLSQKYEFKKGDVVDIHL
jgi:uncharacterized protein